MEKKIILWSGSVFSPTGFGKHSRQMVKALAQFAQIQVDDFYVPRPDIKASELKKFCKPVINDLSDINRTITVINDYPKRWDKGHGIRNGFLIHEGSKIPPDWVPMINRVDNVLVPSTATKRLAKWNGVERPIYVIPEGVDPDFYFYKPVKKDKFRFLFVGSWTGNLIDRKGAGLLIKAFDEEFKDECELFLKLSTFWMPQFDAQRQINQITKKFNPRIKFDQNPLTPEQIRSLYWDCDCFVLPTGGEAFGLTAIEAMASGIPVIITRDKNSGHMDFTQDYVNYIDSNEVRQGSRAFYCEGNMLASPDLDSLKKQMRYVYENYNKSIKLAKKGSDFVREKFSWTNSAKKLLNVFNFM